MSIDMKQVNPNFMVARLVDGPDTQYFAIDRESTMVTDAPLGFLTRRLDEVTDVSPLTRNASRSPQWCEAVRYGEI